MKQKIEGGKKLVNQKLIDSAYQEGLRDGRKDYWEKLESTRDLLFNQAYKLAKQAQQNDH